MKLTYFVLACQVYILLMGEGMLLSEQNLWSWFDAQNQCILQNERLSKDFPKQVNNTEEVAIWTGIYRRISTWIKILGCYTDSATKAVSSSAYIMQKLSKSAGFCQEICLSSDMTIFAIKGKLCRCLKDRPQENEISPTLCNTLCNKPEDRGEKPYFEECGGKESYSVYISATTDEIKPNSSGVLCVAIQCSLTTNTFYFDEYCSSNFHPLCKPTDRMNTSGNWSQSMDICKSKTFPSYLYGDVYLNDINRTCNVIDTKVPESSWLAVANEVYTGIDRGITIGQRERDMFTGCFACFYKNKNIHDCSFVDCNVRLNIQLLCVQRNQEYNRDSSSQTTGTLHTSTFFIDLWSSKVVPKSSVSSTTHITNDMTMMSSSTESLSTTAEIINSEEKSEDALQIIIPTTIAVCLIVVIFALIYLCYRHMKNQPSLQKQKSKQDHGDASKSGPSVTGIINHSYFTIELQERNIRSSFQEENLNTHTEAKEEIYNRLRDTEYSIDKDDTKCNYDTTKNIKAKREQCNESNEGTYNRLGDVICDHTNTDDTYHHALTRTKQNGEYDVTEIRKQYILDSPYNEVLHIVTDERMDDQDRKSDISEKDNEDHTYFILEQD